MPSGRRIAAIVTLLLLGGAPAALGAGAPPIAVIVGASSVVRQLSLDTLRDLYLRRQRVWPTGRRVIPVNLPADDPVRETFSQRVLGRATGDLAGYWNRRYFEGVQPPLVLKTPSAVCAYLAVEPDAVGYVPLEDVDRAACRVLLVLPGAGD